MHNQYNWITMMSARASVEGLSVTAAGSVLIRRPLLRDIGIAIATAYEPHLRFHVMQLLEPAMGGEEWLDMVVRVAAGLADPPTQIIEGLRRSMSSYRPGMFLRGDVAEWWNNAKHPLTIWRGCYEGVNEQGICYSQDPLTAALHVRPGGCGRSKAILIEAVCLDGDYIAHRQRRELEIWALPERPVVVARHGLPLPEAFYRDRTEPLRGTGSAWPYSEPHPSSVIRIAEAADSK